MVYCPSCGYANKDDSPSCANCHQSLFSSDNSAQFHAYQQRRVNFEAEAQVKTLLKKVSIAVSSVVVVFIVIAMVALWIHNRPVVDPELIGTWVSPYNGTQFSFTRDGECTMDINGLWGDSLVDSSSVPYRAKDGTLTFWPNTEFEYSYQYKFVTAIDSNGNSVPVLVIEQNNSTTYVLHKKS